MATRLVILQLPISNVVEPDGHVYRAESVSLTRTLTIQTWVLRLGRSTVEVAPTLPGIRMVARNSVTVSSNFY